MIKAFKSKEVTLILYWVNHHCQDAGVISGVQTVDNGTILYSKELPALSPLNQSLKTLMEPLLGQCCLISVTQNLLFNF